MQKKIIILIIILIINTASALTPCSPPSSCSPTCCNGCIYITCDITSSVTIEINHLKFVTDPDYIELINRSDLCNVTGKKNSSVPENGISTIPESVTYDLHTCETHSKPSLGCCPP